MPVLLNAAAHAEKTTNVMSHAAHLPMMLPRASQLPHAVYPPHAQHGREFHKRHGESCVQLLCEPCDCQPGVQVLGWLSRAFNMGQSGMKISQSGQASGWRVNVRVVRG